jgi:hypothetical protein
MNQIKTAHHLLKIALFLFFISALYGWFMRLSSVYNLPNFDYTRFLQAHSHVTFLGWGFIGVTTLFNYLFLNKQKQFNTKFKSIFGIEVISICLMLISFPLQGYKVFSIVLLSIFLITSYLYIYQFLKHFETTRISKPVTLFIKSSLFFYILSSIGIWAIGIVVATQGKTDLYYNSIYFYLHFLYNGFFVFSLFGLCLYYFEKKNINLNIKYINAFFWITFTSCIPAYILSLVESSNSFIIGVGIFTAALQLLSIPYLTIILSSIKQELTKTLSISSKLLFIFVILAYFLKLILQFTSSFPQLSEQIIALKSYFVIGYIHLVTLGFLSPFLLFLLIQFELITMKNKRNKVGIILFLIGVILTETILFTQGSSILFLKSTLPYYSELLLIASSVLVIGILSFIRLKK